MEKLQWLAQDALSQNSATITEEAQHEQDQQQRGEGHQDVPDVVDRQDKTVAKGPAATIPASTASYAAVGRRETETPSLRLAGWGTSAGTTKPSRWIFEEITARLRDGHVLGCRCRFGRHAVWRQVIQCLTRSYLFCSFHYNRVNLGAKYTLQSFGKIMLEKPLSDSVAGQFRLCTCDESVIRSQSDANVLSRNPLTALLSVFCCYPLRRKPTSSYYA